MSAQSEHDHGSCEDPHPILLTYLGKPKWLQQRYFITAVIPQKDLFQFCVHFLS